MRELERQVLLTVIDRKWREHLYEMDYLKDGIGLRAMAQRDPLIEYQREGFDMFKAMSEGIKEETVGYLFNAAGAGRPPQPEEAAQQGRGSAGSGPAGSGAAGRGAAGAGPGAAAAPQPVAAGRQAPAPQQTGPQRGRPVQQRPLAGPAPAPVDAEATTEVLPAAFRGSRPTDLRYSGPAEDGTATRTRSSGRRRAARRGQPG